MQAIWAVQIGGLDFMVLADTKVSDQAYCHNSLGYDVVCLSTTTMEADRAQGVVGLVVRD